MLKMFARWASPSLGSQARIQPLAGGYERQEAGCTTWYDSKLPLSRYAAIVSPKRFSLSLKCMVMEQAEREMAQLHSTMLVNLYSQE